MNYDNWHHHWWQTIGIQLLRRSTIFATTGFAAITIVFWLQSNGGTIKSWIWLPLITTVTANFAQLIVLRLEGGPSTEKAPSNVWQISWMFITLMHGALWGITLTPLMHTLEGNGILLCMAACSAWALSPHPPAALTFTMAMLLPAAVLSSLGLINITEIHPLTPVAIFVCIMLYILVNFCSKLWHAASNNYDKFEEISSANINLYTEHEKTQLETQQLAEMTMRDHLTGIANRRHLDEFIVREWGRARRSQAHLSVIYIDIDHFKEFNDNEGHAAGDQRLCEVAAVLGQVGRRGGDLAARYGGEEFVLVLAETNLEKACVIAERIRNKISDLNIPHRGNQPYDKVTVSLGVASSVPSESSSIEELMLRADKALYQAKNNGRNCVVQS